MGHTSSTSKFLRYEMIYGVFSLGKGQRAKDKKREFYDVEKWVSNKQGKDIKGTLTSLCCGKVGLSRKKIFMG